MSDQDPNHSVSGSDVALCEPLTHASINPSPESEEAVLIPLVNGGITKISPGDVDAVAQQVWRAVKINGHTYAYTTMNHRRVYLHRLLLGYKYWDVAKGKWVANQVDHRDGEGLTNTRENLRSVNHQLNQRNSAPRLSSRSRFKGVSLAKKAKTRPWRCTIHTGGHRQVSGGSFASEEEAARRYNELAREYFGEYARLNDVDNEPHAKSVLIGSPDPPETAPT